MKQFRKMVYPYLLWSTVVIAVPMLLILLYAFTSGGNSVSKFMFSFANSPSSFSSFSFRSAVFTANLYQSAPSPDAGENVTASKTQTFSHQRQDAQSFELVRDGSVSLSGLVMIPAGHIS